MLVKLQNVFCRGVVVVERVIKKQHLEKSEKWMLGEGGGGGGTC